MLPYIFVPQWMNFLFSGKLDIVMNVSSFEIISCIVLLGFLLVHLFVVGKLKRIVL